MNEFKDILLQEVLTSKMADSIDLDLLIGQIYQEEDIRNVLLYFYTGFFLMTHDIKTDSFREEIKNLNLFQIKQAVMSVAQEVNLLDMFLYYEELLKEAHRIYTNNAVRVLGSIVDNSEEVLSETLKNIGELTEILKAE